LFGLGLGLYWGEGTKANKSAVRLGNTDAGLLNIFIKFLVTFFNIKKKDLRFHMHIFSDIDVDKAYDFWIKKLKVKKEQFYKPFVTRTGKLGTYRKKSKYGVVTVYYCNKKLRDLLINNLPL
jgi:1-acyl-sn-glycerol-3-phosphate acyltransferase